MKTILTLSVSAMAFASATPAHAQSTDAGEQAAPGDIVVTARRIEERLQDVPVAVTAVTGDKLQSLGITQVIDIRQAVSGLNVTAAAGRTVTPIYAIRGQRANDTVITQDPPVAVYMDEAIVTPLAGSNLGLFDLQNMQVLKGPQGTLFGRNTTGGAVLFTTAKPTDRLEGSIRLGYGNYDTKTGTVVLNVPVNDAIRLRGAFDFTKSDGYGRVLPAPGANPGPEVGHKLFSRDELNFRFGAAIDPTDWLQTMTTVYYSRAKNGAPAFQLLDTPNPRGTASVVFGQALTDAVARTRARSVYDTETDQGLGARIRNYGVIHTDTIELSDNLTFKNIFAYRHTSNYDRADLDGTILQLVDASSFTRTKSFSNETQLQGNAFDDRLTYVFGVYYFDQKGVDGNGYPMKQPNRTVGRAGTQYGFLHNSSLSGFGQASFGLTDTLNVTAGLRYTVDRRKADIVSGNFPLTTCAFTDSANAPLPVDDCFATNSRSFAEPSWLIGIDKKLSEDVLIYISSRHSYRSGGFNLRGNTNALASIYFRPEKVTDVEVGFKATQEMGGWRLTSNLAGYYQWYKDIQRNVSTLRGGQIGNAVQNAAGAHVYGGEAEFDLRYGRLFGISVNYAYVKPEYTGYATRAPVFGVPNQPDEYSDRDFGNIPRHQINANVMISPDIGDIGEVKLIGNLYYQSRVFLNDDLQNRAHIIRRLSPAQAETLPTDTVFGQKGYALVNLRAELNNIAGTGLSAAVFARNIFNKRYVDSGLVFQDSLGFDSGIYGAPRTYGAEMTFRF